MNRLVAMEIKDENAYSRESTMLILGGLCAGAAGGLLAMLAGHGQDQLLALSFGAVVGLFANLSDPKEERASLRLVMAILAGGAMAFLLSLQPLLAGATGGLLLGAAMGIGKVKDAGLRRVTEAGSYALLLLAGVFTTRVLFGEGPLAFADVPMMRPVLEGSVWGLFLALAAGINRMSWPDDETGDLFAEALTEVGGEEREILHSGRSLYGRITEELDGEEQCDVAEQARAIATETAQHLIMLARRTDELRKMLSRGRTREINERHERTRARIEQATDDEVRVQLQAALAELEEQRGMGQRIELASTRLEARQQRCITALERLHVALIHNSAALTGSAGLADALSSLQRLTEEMHWKNVPMDSLLENDDASFVDGLDETAADAHLDETETKMTSVPSDEETSEEPAHDVVECLSGTECSP
ncbi:MAG: hypothetical protein ACNA8W_01465 [Bradymonadaceae bacterium]